MRPQRLNLFKVQLLALLKKAIKHQLLKTSSYKQEIRKTKEVADDTGAITYKSSDTSIATVDAKTGVVTLVEVGIITIPLQKQRQISTTQARRHTNLQLSDFP